ncbi:LPXTG cell wall anchor domain-containing protein [Enterococcus faecalis]|uniref:LPXTG cell wall anchor domain-containing protein n=1 Tax=Enterococcus faecalis TaxID=1351 RepID=UPI003CC68630
MKKILLCFVSIGLVSVYFPVQADKVQSKVTGTLIAPEPSSSDKDKASSHKSGGLPKTGEESSLAFGVLGLSFIIIGGGTWYFKKRREDDHA